MSFWRKDGVLVGHPPGTLIKCDHCPCEGAQVEFTGRFHPAIFEDEVFGGASSYGVDVTWSFTGELPLSAVSQQGTGSFTLSGIVANDGSSYSNVELDISCVNTRSNRYK